MQVSDAEWEQLRDADFSSAASLQSLPLTERWIVSALHAVRTGAIAYVPSMVLEAATGRVRGNAAGYHTPSARA